MTRSEWKLVFGNNLIDLLRERRMTQSELAKDAGLSASRISDYISGAATPTIFAIINMAYALDLDVSDLVDFDERIG